MREYKTGATGIDLQILKLLSDGIRIREIAEILSLTQYEVIAIIRKYILK